MIAILMEYFEVAFILAAVILLVILWRFLFKKEFVEPTDLAVFISGCDTGLGNCLAKYFDSLGCDVFAGCLNPIVSRRSLPESITIVPLDICGRYSARHAVLKVKKILEERGKHLWALVNNAGVCVYGEFEWQTWEQCRRQVEVNFLGTIRLTKAFLPLLRKNKGRIITITSINGSISYPGLSVYSATKFALEGLCHAIRLELRRQHGIKVIIVKPGDFSRLTSIMSQHEKNAREMWNKMCKEDQEEFKDFFRMYQRVAMKNYGLACPRNLSDSTFFKDMEDALLNTNPRIRYISARKKHRMFYKFLELMPFEFVDGFLDKITDMLFKTDSKSS